VVDAALQQAEAIVREHEVITPNAEEWERLQDLYGTRMNHPGFVLLLNPPAPNERLQRALAEYKRIVRR